MFDPITPELSNKEKLEKLLRRFEVNTEISSHLLDFIHATLYDCSVCSLGRHEKLIELTKKITPLISEGKELAKCAK